VVSHLLSCDWSTDPVNDLGLAEAAQQAMVAAAQGGHEQVKIKSFSTIDNFYIKLPLGIANVFFSFNIFSFC